jgi:RNA polymerase sigma-70 factor (ECF subfamily)
MGAEEAQETIQETFLRLHLHLSAGGSRENLRSWVFRVAHNHARNCQKTLRFRVAEPVPDGADPTAGPEQLLLEKERMERLHTAMSHLPGMERQCLHLRAEGLRYREIAEVLEIGVTTVADHLERAIRKLAKELP